MSLSRDNVNFLKENSDLIGEVNAEILNSLEIKGGEYSDVFYTNKKGSLKGTFRNFRTQIMRWLIPTNTEDRIKIFQTRKKLGSSDNLKVLKHLMNERD